MILIPIIGALGLAAAGTVCWRGLPTESGTGPAGRWRIRWACWRWLAEMQQVEGRWTRVAAFRMGEQALAKAAAMSSVSTLAAALDVAPMVTIVGRRAS